MNIWIAKITTISYYLKLQIICFALAPDFTRVTDTFTGAPTHVYNFHICLNSCKSICQFCKVR